MPDDVKIADADLPPSAIGILLSGLPQQIAFADDVSPTLFTNAVNGTRVREVAGGYVIGSIQERVRARADLALFVLERGTGVVNVVDDERDLPAYVNSDLDKFFTCLAALLQEPQAEVFRNTLERIDASVTTRSSFWNAWIEDLENK